MGYNRKEHDPFMPLPPGEMRGHDYLTPAVLVLWVIVVIGGCFESGCSHEAERVVDNHNRHDTMPQTTKGTQHANYR